MVDLEFEKKDIDKNRIAVVTGVSASGKDFLIGTLRNEYSKELVGLNIVNSGELLFQKVDQVRQEVKGSLDSRDQLKVALSPEQIRLLIRDVVNEILYQQPALVNNHTVFKQNGYLQINPDVERQLNAADYFFIWADAGEIVLRRNDQARKRDKESTDDICLHQAIAMEATRAIAYTLGAGFRVIYNRVDNVRNNTARIIELLREYK